MRWFLGSLSVLLDSAICALMPFPVGGVGIGFGDLSPPSYSVSYLKQSDVVSENAYTHLFSSAQLVYVF